MLDQELRNAMLVRLLLIVTNYGAEAATNLVAFIDSPRP
jgi:hypothetical protein